MNTRVTDPIVGRSRWRSTSTWFSLVSLNTSAHTHAHTHRHAHACTPVRTHVWSLGPERLDTVREPGRAVQGWGDPRHYLTLRVWKQTLRPVEGGVGGVDRPLHTCRGTRDPDGPVQGRGGTQTIRAPRSPLVLWTATQTLQTYF